MCSRIWISCVAWLLLGGSSACKRPPELADRVRARIESALPRAHVEVTDAATLRVTLDEQRVTLSLDNLAVLCRDEPTRCDEAIDRMVRNLEHLGAPAAAPSREALRLVLRSRQTMQDYQQAIAAESPPDKLADNQPVTYPFHADLVQVLVRDLPDGIAVVMRGDLRELQLDAESARALGLANLEKAAGSLPVQPAAPGVLRVRIGDNYEAARLLLPGRWQEVAKQVHGELVVAAPTRDDVLAAGSDDAQAISALRELAGRAYQAGPYPLSTALLRLTSSGFVAYAP